ncbi:MAG: protein kinase [Gammaproteobacteria bacterium]|nr:protein kinase [Gammaproteobacteria bacterium]MBU0770307.1 protein kinase [Gammaproteobacteria bacterium]MBU0857249.1 protein kinase [Gammaproteobacteria bacterium]MBU1847924.1 protein kinase [Gammaproteobacteria bacterium]
MAIPARLGKYEILRELGQGAMGIVYAGRDPVIDRQVAIKTLKREQLERSEADEVIARFKREAQAAGRLNHPNVVAIYEYGEEADGTAFIAMEFVQGRELKEVFDADERVSLPMVGRIMGQLLAALEHAHRNGVTHRDIKPANIIMLADGTVKVADFGVARLESSNLTQAGTVMGTPSYMSPEQWTGQTVDGRSDLFSAGVVLYQLLTGEKPFTGALTTIMHKVLKEDPTWPSVLNVHVHPQLDAVVRKALAKRPDDRFQDAAQFRSALDAALAAPATVPAADEDATVVTPVDPDTTRIGANADADADATVQSAPRKPAPATTAPAYPETPAPSSATRQTPPPTTLATARRPLVPLLGGIAALIVLATAGWMFVRGDGAQEPADTPTVAMTEPAGAPAAAAPPPAAQADTLPTDPGVTIISAIGLADPQDPRFTDDRNALAQALRDDARRQILEKAVALFVDPKSVNANYAALQDRLLDRSGDFIQAVLKETQPELGKDGLMSGEVRAAVRVRQVQKSLNQMSQDERIDFIRNNGDPKIAVAVSSRWADGDPAAPAQRSALAENTLKQHIQSFGFRTWNDEAGSAQTADFTIDGEVRFKRLRATLAASGLTIEKVVLTSWTVRCTDRKSGEEVYLNTQVPEGMSWGSEEKALGDIGKQVGEQFSRNFFLSHFHFTARKVALELRGLPGQDVAGSLLREIASMRAVLGADASALDDTHADIAVNMSGGLADIVQNVQAGILMPLSRKLGRNCLNVASSGTDRVTLDFDPACKTPEMLTRLQTLPPAAFLEAAPARREDVVRNPETLKRISI